MEEVNVYCQTKYDPKIHKMLFCTPPHQVFDHKGYQECNTFLTKVSNDEKSPEAKNVWNTFVERKQHLLHSCGK